MKQANLIIGSKEVIATLNRTAAARIKADGENCSHLMHEIGMTDEEGYGEQLQVARSDAVVIPTPTDMQAAHVNRIICRTSVHAPPSDKLGKVPN